MSRALDNEEPPSYQPRQPRESLLEPYQAKIHALLSQDPKLSGVNIYNKIKPEGYQGQLTILRDYLRDIRPQYQPRTVYLRMSYEPGEYGQVDWAEMPGPVLWQSLRLSDGAVPQPLDVSGIQSLQPAV